MLSCSRLPPRIVITWTACSRRLHTSCCSRYRATCSYICLYFICVNFYLPICRLRPRTSQVNLTVFKTSQNHRLDKAHQWKAIAAEKLCEVRKVTRYAPKVSRVFTSICRAFFISNCKVARKRYFCFSVDRNCKSNWHIYYLAFLVSSIKLLYSTLTKE